jgi:hypothetical protein
MKAGMKKDGSRFWANIVTMALKVPPTSCRICESGARLH